MFAEGLQGLLESDFDLLETVVDGQQLVDAAERLQPDLIVADISMPVLNGLDAIRQLRAKGNSAKVLFLTMHADDRLLVEAFRCGGSGYVLKQSAGEDLIFAIRQVLSGHRYVTPLVASEWAHDTAGKTDQTQKLMLTPRQREVLQLVIEGFTMKEVGTKLGISTRTAESHKYDMMGALGMNSTAELVQYALKLGLTAEPSTLDEDPTQSPH
jgi:DNA-binding NarL/FixJ family response regulator